jgi:hypothetical protein
MIVFDTDDLIAIVAFTFTMVLLPPFPPASRLPLLGLDRRRTGNTGGNASLELALPPVLWCNDCCKLRNTRNRR